jgi:hypothetical protein
MDFNVTTFFIPKAEIREQPANKTKDIPKETLKKKYQKNKTKRTRIKWYL